MIDAEQAPHHSLLCLSVMTKYTDPYRRLFGCQEDLKAEGNTPSTIVAAARGYKGP